MSDDTKFIISLNPVKPSATVTIPRWQQLKDLCDKLPDTPRSRYERNGVRIARVAATMRGVA